MKKPVPVIAIDGTAASGKGTMARRLATHLDYAYLDTGLLYRRVAYTLFEKGLPFEEADAALQAARTLDATKLDDPALRGPEAGRGSSIVAAMPTVRLALYDFQREFPAKSGKPGAILDGRDIGTVIFPEAILKFYVDADQAERARRRHKELLGQGLDVFYEKVLEDMKIRDARDAGRPDAPMKAAPDAIHIDTTHMGPDEVFQEALKYIQDR
ncbi:MAG: (d)CMP kinase [Micavibrio aeruginosavorus]|uniref:Cytidylate kinase n=1 Tax=Micavibrio aeruginosavorus TaxID=349221 RepID=A0A7T5R2B1_9BACT|nr:MAG: (d)CMP kinase [Micavibrio aeruginosavorus]